MALRFCAAFLIIYQLTGALSQFQYRFPTPGTRSFRHLKITYRILHYTKDLPKAKVDSEIQKAFTFWAKVTPLTFTRLKNGQKADIQISFEYFKSFKVLTFSKSLAYTMLQPQPKVTFNDYFCWTSSRYWGKNLVQVAVHEFGTILGLAASTNSSSVMFNVYKGYDPDFALSEDDVAAVQALYGRRFGKQYKELTSGQ